MTSAAHLLPASHNNDHEHDCAVCSGVASSSQEASERVYAYGGVSEGESGMNPALLAAALMARDLAPDGEGCFCEEMPGFGTPDATYEMAALPDAGGAGGVLNGIGAWGDGGQQSETHKATANNPAPSVPESQLIALDANTRVINLLGPARLTVKKISNTIVNFRLFGFDRDFTIIPNFGDLARDVTNGLQDWLDNTPNWQGLRNWLKDGIAWLRDQIEDAIGELFPQNDLPLPNQAPNFGDSPGDVVQDAIDTITGENSDPSNPLNVDRVRPQDFFGADGSLRPAVGPAVGPSGHISGSSDPEELRIQQEREEKQIEIERAYQNEISKWYGISEEAAKKIEESRNEGNIRTRREWIYSIYSREYRGKNEPLRVPETVLNEGIHYRLFYENYKEGKEIRFLNRQLRGNERQYLRYLYNNMGSAQKSYIDNETARRNSDQQALNAVLHAQFAERTPNLSQQWTAIWHKVLVEKKLGDSMERLAQEASEFMPSEDDYISQVKDVIKAVALRYLNENRELINNERLKYPEPTGSSLFFMTQQTVDQTREDERLDSRLATAQEQLENLMVRAKNTLNPRGVWGLSEPLSPSYPLEADPPIRPELAREILRVAPGNLAEIQAARAKLLERTPAVGVLDEDDISTNNDAQFLSTTRKRFDDLLHVIQQVEQKLHDDEIPITKLGPVVEEVRPTLDANLRNALTRLEDRERDKRFFNIEILTLADLGLAAAAIVAAVCSAPITAGVLGVAGLILGIRNASYALGEAGESYQLSRVNNAGGNSLIDDSGDLRDEYIWAWINLVLVGIDVLDVGQGIQLLRGANRIADASGVAGILGRLTPEQTDKLSQILREGRNTVEGRRLMGELTAELGGIPQSRLEQALDELGDEATAVGPTRPGSTGSALDPEIFNIAQPVRIGGEDHTIRIRAINGEPVLYLCSNCGRLTDTLRELAPRYAREAWTRKRVREIEQAVHSFERSLRDGAIASEAEIERITRVFSTDIEGISSRPLGQARPGNAELHYELKAVDLDWRNRDSRNMPRVIAEALDEAFSRTGVPRDEFIISKTDRTPDGVERPVQWDHQTKAQVSIDYGHYGIYEIERKTKKLVWGTGPDNPHVGWQTGGKKDQVTGHILLPGTLTYGRPLR